MQVGISDTAAGHKSGSVPVNFTSLAAAGSGLSNTGAGTQTVQMTGDVYGYAVANTLGTPVPLGNIHAGDSFVAQNVSVQNVAPNTGYYENLEAAAGSWDVTILPGNSANLSAGIVDNTPGAKDVPVTVNFTSKAIAAGLSDTPLSSQTVHVTGNVYGYAVANTLGTPIDLGNIHAGDSFVAQNVSVQNVAPNTGYYENLEAAAGSWDVTILPGNSANLSAGIGDSTPGAKDVPVTVSFTSKAIAAGLSDTPLGTQTVHVTGNVYGYAVANTLGTPIDLGNIHAGDSFVAQNVSVQNVAPNTGYYENLEAAAGSWDVTILPGNSANLSAGIVDNTPGAKDVSVTVNFTSKAIAAGLSDTPLGTQTVHVTGNVYGYAVANTLGTPIDLGNIHAGDSFVAQNVSVQNVAPNTGYYENLEAAAGGWTTVIVPGDSANMPVNISDNTAGHKAVSVPVSLTSKAIASGLSDTALPTQTVTVTGNVYDYAAPAPIASPGNVGKVYTNTPVSRTLTVANSAPASSYSEGLNATFGATGGGMTGVGSLVNLAGGDSNSAVMSVMLDTSSAGGKHGSAVVNFVSNGANSGLGDTDRGSQLVTMDADVYDHGVASFDAAEPLAVYSFVLSGSLNETVTKQYDIYNLLQTAGFTGKLDLTDVIGGGDTAKINSGLSTFVDLAANDSKQFTASLDTSAVGSYSADFIVHLTDSASDGIGGGAVIQTLDLQINGQVVPEPSTLVLLSIGLFALVSYLRRRARS